MKADKILRALILGVASLSWIDPLRTLTPAAWLLPVAVLGTLLISALSAKFHRENRPKVVDSVDVFFLGVVPILWYPVFQQLVLPYSLTSQVILAAVTTISSLILTSYL